MDGMTWYLDTGLIRNMIYKIKKSVGGRLSEMGLINNSIVRVVKQIFGMSYIKLKDSYLIIRQDIFDNLDKERIR